MRTKRARLTDHRARRGIWWLLACAALAVIPSAVTAQAYPLGREASAPPELALDFDGGMVSASELTPSGDAVFFGMDREPQGY